MWHRALLQKANDPQEMIYMSSDHIAVSVARLMPTELLHLSHMPGKDREE